ncbi:unnamed protein product [Clavelina lepadiformis]|uniref:Transposase n=1 Tax=Clavelina lepadiformis TaxID=159417 RepID=A0ABP0H2L8_CLALP
MGTGGRALSHTPPVYISFKGACKDKARAANKLTLKQPRNAFHGTLIVTSHLKSTTRALVEEDLVDDTTGASTRRLKPDGSNTRKKGENLTRTLSLRRAIKNAYGRHPIPLLSKNCQRHKNLWIALNSRTLS